MTTLPAKSRVYLWRFSHALAVAMLLHVVLGRWYAGSYLGQEDLMWASLYGNTGQMWLLLDSGADPNREGDLDCSALEASVRGGQVESARLLLQWDADPNYHGESVIQNGLSYGFNYGFGSKRVWHSDIESVVALLRSVGGKD